MTADTAQVGRNLNDQALTALAGLLHVRHTIDDEIAKLIGLTPTSGHIGEVVAGAIFDIELALSGVNAGYDGVFRSGPLAGRTVNVKAYSERAGLLDINPHPCDWYLVLMGPARSTAEKGRPLPFRIEQVFLFQVDKLRADLAATGVAIGVATSVRRGYWEAARLYPESADGLPLALDARQRQQLALFA